MSRKSRQKKGRTLLQKAFPTWLALPMLIVSLFLGAVACLSPLLSTPPPFEDTIQCRPDCKKHKPVTSGITCMLFSLI